MPPRSKGIPDDAVDPDRATEEIRTALDGKTVVVRSGDVLTDLSTCLRDLGIPRRVPTGYGRRHELHQMTLAWRGMQGLRWRRLSAAAFVAALAEARFCGAGMGTRA
ncbi:hypothetical protein [Streptomyces sp. NPDC056323]|uniref:hypothetical protein n=1 Tax=Streptomyces sp. NPDC056323 TaxID=3345784 RepID=UPI0035DEB0B6